MRGHAGASCALRLDDRDAGQRLSDLDRRRHEVSFFGLFTFRTWWQDEALEEAASQAHFVFAWAIAIVLARIWRRSSGTPRQARHGS